MRESGIPESDPDELHKRARGALLGLAVVVIPRMIARSASHSPVARSGRVLVPSDDIDVRAESVAPSVRAADFELDCKADPITRLWSDRIHII